MEINVPGLSVFVSKSEEVNSAKLVASGNVGIYSWCVTRAASKQMLEIADDPAIQIADLPLVGYGCGGWLAEAPVSEPIESFLQQSFERFANKTLKHVPAVSCACSDL